MVNSISKMKKQTHRLANMQEIIFVVLMKYQLVENPELLITGITYLKFLMLDVDIITVV